MSYQNFGDGNGQPQQGAEEQGGYGAPGGMQQQHQMGQQMDPTQQNQFSSAPQSGGPGGPGAGPPSAGDQKTTLWYGNVMFELPRYKLTIILRMGELEPWIDENFVRSVWFGLGYQVNVKMIRDKFSGFVSSQPSL